MALAQKQNPQRPASTRADYTIEQDHGAYTTQEHGIWRTLFERQQRLLVGRAAVEFLDGISALGVAADGIPDFRRLNEVLQKRTGWRIVAVPGLVPDAIFFEHLANRRFPSTCFIRRPDQLDYIEEPDIFHDVFGHVPLLVHPVFGDYMQAYGEGGIKALRLGGLHNLARLYWYTVEFGLMRTDAGMRIYGSGIVSSKGESVYALDDPGPNRLRFDLLRIMRTNYRIDDFQETYFVIDDFEELFDATRPDFTPYYRELARRSNLEPGDVLSTDEVLHRGSGRRHRPV
ncbi:MAG: phenylalanine 4-monooxygenase [Proteobacteria bacterium]|nr:phenylalanine 4-monooxygenase [Pseudomonadota bacterium]MBI3498676.1 phenylalanine 4-monooxygenase [Pseudomonadota bacterium]